MKYKRMPIEIESPEEMGYSNIKYNLAESSVRDCKLSDLGTDFEDILLNYSDHRGRNDLRQLICEDSSILEIDDILITQSAALALFIVNTSLLSAEDHLIVIRPNYATNIETPKAIGCEITYIDLIFENSYAIDIQEIVSNIKPNTKLISITTPHNPTGIDFDRTQIESLIYVIENNGIHLLIDETYRELNFQSKLQAYFAEKSKNIISIASISKAYGLPGLRIGWIICQDLKMLDLFLAAKEQIIICNSVIDEYLASLALKNKANLLKQSHLTLKNNFAIVKKWIANHLFLAWNEPKVGAVCFVKFKEGIDFDFTNFYQILLSDFGTQVGPGHWFEQNDRYFRLGFGFPTEKELKTGLQKIDDCIALFLKK
jgi:aspartate/methionine/tyrosine aminotransferase